MSAVVCAACLIADRDWQAILKYWLVGFERGHFPNIRDVTGVTFDWNKSKI